MSASLSAPVLPSGEWAIALGAILGAGARFAIVGLAGPPAVGALPLGTLSANLIGCLLIGVMQTLFLELVQVRRELQLAVSVGFLGGLTTFSSVSVETVRLWQAGAPAAALGYQLVSLIGGGAAAALGIVLARRGYRAFARGRGRQ